MSKNSKYMIGIDEAGRGPLAGPVVVAGIRIGARDKKQATRIFKDIKDSKKLTIKQREGWFRLLTAHPEIRWAAAKVWPRVIDRINIARATNLGASRVCGRLSSTNYESSTDLRITNSRILLDGGLKLPGHIPHEAIIKGDERVPVIAAASIIAKVIRDRIMLRLHKKYPQYGFDRHKGYGTQFHKEMLKKHGPSPIHRKSFRWV